MTVNDLIRYLKKIEINYGDWEIGIADAGKYDDVMGVFLVVSSGDKRGVYLAKERNENERD